MHTERIKSCSGLLMFWSFICLLTCAHVVCGSLKLWRVTDSSHIQTIGHAGRITCVAFSRDSLYVVTGSEDLSLKVWEANTGKLTQVRRPTPHFLSESDYCNSCTTKNDSAIFGFADIYPADVQNFNFTHNFFRMWVSSRKLYILE